jgi:hypothetical protein
MHSSARFQERREVFESRTGEGHFWQHEEVELAGYEASKRNQACQPSSKKHTLRAVVVSSQSSRLAYPAMSASARSLEASQSLKQGDSCTHAVRRKRSVIGRLAGAPRWARPRIERGQARVVAQVFAKANLMQTQVCKEGIEKSTWLNRQG